MTPNNDFLDNLAADQHEKMLREIANDDLTPKKRDKKQETEIFENEIPAGPPVSYTHLTLPTIYSV